MEDAQRNKIIAFHSYPTLPCLLAFQQFHLKDWTVWLIINMVQVSD